MKPSAIALICLVLVTACSKSGGSGGDSQPLGWPTLISPQNNTACFTGVPVDSNHASITFSWQAATNAATYDLVVTNLNDAKQTNYFVTGTSTDVVLIRAQPYSWNVWAKSEDKTADSTGTGAWRFYVAGTPETIYAPFPAIIIEPLNNAIVPSSGGPSSAVLLEWSGSDISNDIAYYTIYLDNTNASTKVIPSTTSESATLTLEAQQTYYWRVVTTDSQGNTSDSGIYTFTI
jgi:hypothetical protein